MSVKTDLSDSETRDEAALVSRRFPGLPDMAMTLRAKSLVAVVLALVLSAGLMYGLSRPILVGQLLAVESDRVQTDTSVAVGAIDHELGDLDTRVYDYAAWDDTYEFVGEPSHEYVESNFVDSLYTSAGLNFVAVVESGGDVVYSRLVDPQTLDEREIPTELNDLWGPGGLLLVAGNEGLPKEGIVRTSAGSFLVASRPVLRSDETGPSRGVLVMGKSIDAVLIGSLRQLTRLDMWFEAPGATEGDTGVDFVTGETATASSITVAPLDSSTIAGETTLNDIYGRPALKLRVQSPRVVYREGLQAISEFVLVVFAIIVAIGIALNLSLHAWVLVPLRSLSRQLTAIARKKTHSARVKSIKGVEFGALEREVNHLLGELETAQLEVSALYGAAREQADRDVLTGMLSRRAVFEKLEKSLALAKTQGGRLALMMVDIDGFKIFNDTHGHLAGDRIIQTVGDVLARHTRGRDVVGRYGGDEFLVVLPGADVEGAVSQAERMLASSIELTWRSPDDVEVPISLSIGVAAYPSHGSEINELIAYADSNLYGVKQMGGHGVSSQVFAGTGEAEGHGFGMLDGLISAVTERDHYTRRHSEQVASYAVTIGEGIGLPSREVRALRIAGLLHDVGKTGIPASVLLKPGDLTTEEHVLMRQHVDIGLALIRDVPEIDLVLDAVAAHHERVDGKGYPRGLTGDEIPLVGRILAVADAYSAMRSNRPYRRALSPTEIGDELLEAAGTQLDAQLVEAFLSALSPEDGGVETSPLDGDGSRFPSGWRLEPDTT